MAVLIRPGHFGVPRKLLSCSKISRASGSPSNTNRVRWSDPHVQGARVEVCSVSRTLKSCVSTTTVPTLARQPVRTALRHQESVECREGCLA